MDRLDGSSLIDVDGFKRPRFNSNKQPIHSADEGIKNFWRWFGNGRAMVWSDNLPRDVIEHELKWRRKKVDGYEFRVMLSWYGDTYALEGAKGHLPSVTLDTEGRPEVFYLTKDISALPESSQLLCLSATKSDTKRMSEDAEIIPVYVSARRPFNSPKDPISQQEADALGDSSAVDYLRENGFDSAWIKDDDSIMLAVLDWSQIKATAGNSGDFSPHSNDIFDDVGFAQGKDSVSDSSESDESLGMQ